MFLIFPVAAMRMARNIAGRALLKNSQDIVQVQEDVSKYIEKLNTNPNQRLQQFHLYPKQKQFILHISCGTCHRYYAILHL